MPAKRVNAGRFDAFRIHYVKQSHPRCVSRRLPFIDVIIPLRRVSTSQHQNTQHSQHQNYYHPRYPTRKTTYVTSRAVCVVLV